MTTPSTPHTYRGYTIRRHDGLGAPWYFEHDSFDGPGDTRYGYGDDLADCMWLIDDQIADADRARTIRADHDRADRMALSDRDGGRA